MSAMKAVTAPSGLASSGGKLWRSVAQQWASDQLTPDARERRLLEDACREADTLAALESVIEAAIKRDQIMVTGSARQIAVHPAVEQARKSRAQILALLKAVGMDDPAAGHPVGRGGRTTSTVGRAAAMRRYGTDGA